MQKRQRFSQRTTSIAGTPYLEIIAYDTLGRPASQRDAAGYTLTSHYSTAGYVQSLSDSRVNGTVYEMLSMNARGQALQDRRGANANLLGTMSYDAPTGRPLAVCAGAACALQDLSYSFDKVGNLTQRARAISTQPTIEAASYDALNRLTAAALTEIQGVVQIPPAVTTSVGYDKLGNVCNNSGINYSYAGRAGCPNHGSAGSPHAVTSRVGVVSYTYDADGNFATGSGGRAMAWNALNQMTRVAAGTTQTTFDYAPNGARFRRVDNGATTTYTIGNVEIVKVPGSTEYRRYLGGVAIDYLRSVGGNETRYVFSDHLGSPSVFANPSGAQLEAQSFNALGNRRDASNWQTLIGPMASTTHGFTGHEHVDALNVIHMNGRVYDPQIGRMLQPDPLADGTNQGLNRYTYVVNNPLSLTDPSGYFSWGGFLQGVAVIAITVYTGGAAAGYWSFFGASITAGSAAAYGVAALGGFAAGTIASGSVQGGLYGAFSGVLFAGIGSGFQQAGWAQDLSTTGVMGSGLNGIGFSARVLASGVAGGVVSDLQGGKFGNGFISAGASSAVSPYVESIGNTPGQVIAAAAVGGTISVIAGGKFANGAMTGAFQQAFEEVANGARQGEGGRWLTPAGMPTDLNSYNTFDTNGILGGSEANFQKLANLQQYPEYYNPSHGILADLLESFGQKFFGWSGDPLAQGFAEGLAGIDHPFTVIAHSQGVMTVVDAAAYYGLPTNGNTFDMRSGASSYFAASSALGPSMQWSMPYGDIANLYSGTLNPIRWASGIHDVLCAACTHTANGITGH